MIKIQIGLLLRRLIALIVALALTGCRGDTKPHSVTLNQQSASSVSDRRLVKAAHSTRFILTENPISESGKWINGKAIGLDWADVASTPGLVYGTETGTSRYDDSTALLSGIWGPDQTVEATVYTVNQNDKIYEEVELRLRSSLSPHRSTGYEINFRCSKTANAYTEIVRWNGRLGDFTYLSQKRGAKYGVANGDAIKATIAGNVITAYINGVQVNQAIDGTYTNGSPGIGFYLQEATGVNRDYGFTTLTAFAAPLP